jgi:phosphoribosyl 1,2-cyclic phosphodiesterase
MGERRAPSLPPIQHAEQQQLPFQGTMSVRKPGAPTFKQTGLGKFFNPRNVNGEQFNKPEVQHQLQNMARAHTRSQYFRRAGFGAALRYTLDMEQVPSHVQDYLNARSNPRNVTGIHPGPMHSYYSPGKDVDPEA